MQKRGELSRLGVNLIISSLIIILIIVIWIILRGVLNFQGQAQTFNDSNLDLKISQVQNIDDSKLNVTVKRNPGEGDFIALSFLVDDGAVTEVIRKNISMNENENSSFSLDFISLNASKTKKVSVTPIFINESGQEVLGNVKDEYITPNVCSTYCPTGAQCGVNGCGTSCGSGCSSGYLCLNYKCIKESAGSSGGGGGGSGGTSNTCATTCSSLVYQCGTQTICGSSVNCGVCLTEYYCSSGLCIQNTTCTDTCSTFGYACGTRTICGSSVNCGTCGTNYTCQANGTCIKLPTGSTYYISTSGNDTNGNGSINRPWKTLAKACNSVTIAGSTIHVNSGTYIETQQCTLNVGVSLEGEGEGSVITSNTLTAEGSWIIEAHSDPTINGNQEIRYLKFDGNNRIAGTAIDIRGRNNVKVHHCKFINFNWWAVGWTSATPTGQEENQYPSAYITGSEFYNNNVTNCAGYDPSWYRGALLLGGQEGMLIHDNYMLETGRAVGTQGWPIKFWYYGGWSKGVKIYNNYLKKTDFSVWDFAIEGAYQSGMEIYNNTIIGAIDLNLNRKGNYNYSVWIHDNLLGPDTTVTGLSSAGIILEFDNENVLIERNIIRNSSPCIIFTPRTGAQKNITIRYNVCKDIRTSTYFYEGLRIVEPSNIQIDGFYLYNNVFYGFPNSNLQYGISIASGGTYTGHDMKFINNIFSNFDSGFMQLSNAGAINGLNIQNNLLYNNGNNNLPQLTGTPTNYVSSGNIIGNPLFVNSAIGDFHLQSTSPAINNGTNVGLTKDFEGNSIVGNLDIGAYEYQGVICTDTCSTFGYACGTRTICGSSVNCGTCGTNYTCQANGTCIRNPTGNTYYISTTGIDDGSRNGSSIAPWRTLSYACGRVTTPGSTIHVNSGTFIETTQCNLAVGVSIEGEGVSSSTINFNVPLANPIYPNNPLGNMAVLLVSSSLGTNGNQHISNLKMTGSNMATWGAIFVLARSNVSVYNCQFSNFYHTAVMFYAQTSPWTATEPTVYATGNNFYNNIINNSCNFYISDPSYGTYASGALQMGGQDGMNIYNNTMIQNSRAAGHNGYLIKTLTGTDDGGYNKGLKIYKNTLIKAPPTNDGMDWNFAIELWFSSGGLEIYNNTIYGGIDILGTMKRNYSYGARIHDNIIGYSSLQTYDSSANNAAVYMDEGQESVYIYNNLIRNTGTPIQMYPDYGNHVSDVYIYYNIFNGLGVASGGSSGWHTLLAYAISTDKGTGNPVLNNINFLNNVIYVGSGGANYGLQIPDSATATNISVRNNIFQGFGANPVFFNLGSGYSIDNLSIENNTFYGNGNNAVSSSGTPTHYTNKNNLASNPLFVSAGSNFHLQSSSPCINNGLSVGLTKDFEGKSIVGAPDIGAYEY